MSGEKIAIVTPLRNEINNIEDWKFAPLWSPETIKTATKDWFKYLGK